MTRKAFDGGTVATTLSGSINASVTTLTVASGSTYPTGPVPFVIAVSRNTANEEKMLVASRSGNVFSITTRGYDGTVASAHNDGATVEHVLDALTIDEANEIANVMTSNGDLITRTSGNPARIALGTTGHPLVAGATAPGYAQLGTAGIADEAVTSAKIQNLTIVDGDISTSAAIADSKLATIATANKVNVSAIDLDGATDIGGALDDTDLILVDDGGTGTNRRSVLSRVATWLFAKVSGDITISSTGVAAIGADKVTSAMIGNGVIGPSELATNAVEEAKINANAVTAAKIAANAVETAKINNGAVTNAKLNTAAGELGGAWASYTPVLTQSGGVTCTVDRAVWTRIGKTIHFMVALSVTGTGTANNAVTVSLPATAATSLRSIPGGGYIGDVSATTNFPGIAFLQTTTTVVLFNSFTTTSSLQYALGGTGSGFTAALANGDVVQISGTYEEA